MGDVQILESLKLSKYQEARAERMLYAKINTLEHVRELSHQLVEQNNTQIKVLEAHITNLNEAIKRKNQPRPANFSFVQSDLNAVGTQCDIMTTSLVQRNEK